MDYRLVAADMDGTLLDQDGKVPAEFPEIYRRLTDAGCTFAPASGRQLATLRTIFGSLGSQLSYIAENGAVVVHRGEITSTTPMDPGSVLAAVRAVEDYNEAHQGEEMRLIVCEPEVAYVTTHEAAENPEVRKYYLAVELTGDIEAVARRGDVIKLAVYLAGSSESVIEPLLRRAVPGQQPAISGPDWVDLMNPAANKGHALGELAGYLGCDMSQTLAFGDYLNDVELVKAAGTSYAMANAHPQLKDLADHVAPSNAEHGVPQVLDSMLRGDGKYC